MRQSRYRMIWGVSEMNSDELMELYFNLEKWHETRVDRLKAVINQDADIQVKMPSGENADLNKRDAMMFRMGMQVALGFFEKLPIKLTGALPEVCD